MDMYEYIQTCVKCVCIYMDRYVPIGTICILYVYTRTDISCGSYHMCAYLCSCVCVCVCVYVPMFACKYTFRWLLSARCTEYMYSDMKEELSYSHGFFGQAIAV